MSISLALLTLLCGCQAPARYNLTVNNTGYECVTDVNIRYDDGSYFSFGNVTWISSHSSVDVKLPETATLNWVDARGIAHHAVIPLGEVFDINSNKRPYNDIVVLIQEDGSTRVQLIKNHEVAADYPCRDAPPSDREGEN